VARPVLDDSFQNGLLRGIEFVDENEGILGQPVGEIIGGFDDGGVLQEELVNGEKEDGFFVGKGGRVEYPDPRIPGIFPHRLETGLLMGKALFEELRYLFPEGRFLFGPDGLFQVRRVPFPPALCGRKPLPRYFPEIQNISEQFRKGF